MGEAVINPFLVFVSRAAIISQTATDVMVSRNPGLPGLNGKKGMRGYCHEMPIVIDRFGGKMQNAYPYSAKSAEGMRKLMDFLWLKTPIGQWLS